MNRAAQARQLLADLIRLEGEWTSPGLSPARQVALREQLKCIEAQLAVLRLLQSEPSLSQKLPIAGIGFLGGSAVVAVLQRVF